MTIAPMPPNEEQRLAALRALNILDTPPDERFDRITRLAQRLLGVPIAAVNLIDMDRQFTKSVQGLPNTRAIPRNVAFCAHTILGQNAMVIPDTTQDERFAGSPFVKNAPKIRFYAGQPLVTQDGSAVGTLCVMDNQPRQMSEADLKVLSDLASIVQDELNLISFAEFQIKLDDTNKQLSLEIDQRRKAEAEALEAVQLQKTLFESAGVILIATNLQGTITAFNKVAEQKLGYSASEVVGKATPALFHDPTETSQRANTLVTDHAETIKPDFDVLLARSRQGLTDDHEWTHVAKDGSRFPAMLSISPIRDSQNTITGFLGVATDITERKQTEQALAASAARFTDIVATMPGAIFQSAYGKTGWRITYISPNVFDIVGVTADAMIENMAALIQRFHPDDVSGFISSGNAAREAMLPWYYEGRFIKPSGEIGWWEGSSVPHAMPDGEMVFNGVFLNITERKRAEAAVRASEAELAETQRLARLGRWTWDVATSEVTWSGVMYDLFDVSHDTVPTLDLFNLRLHPADREEATSFMRQAFQSDREAYSIEYRVVRQDGEIHDHYGVGRIVRDAEGKPLKVLGTSQDITERKKAERQIQIQNEALVKTNRELAVARRQAEAANRLKSQFLATMSHELRTPLNAVIGYAQLQLAGMAGDMTDEQLNYQERILVNAQHLLKLINEVLDLSKIEAGRMELVQKPYNLRACLEEALMQSQVLADSKGLSIELNFDDRLPAALIGDPSRIKQIVLNLLSNGIKFTEQGYIKIDAQKHDKDSWKLTVTDSGIGIPPHLQETIFDEFRQVDYGPTRQYGGTGLGLAIVRRLVLMMGGTIRVNSQVGQGSAFTITLPIVAEVDIMVEAT